MRTTRAGQPVEQGRMVFVEAPIEPLRDGDLLVRIWFASSCGSDLHGAQFEPGQAAFRTATEHIGRSEIDERPLLSHVLPVEEILDAFQLADEYPDSVLKVSIAFWSQGAE